ncbi:MAG: hypothetical protein ACK4PI_00160 [Tepidisphaerales bacterium]
MARFTAVAIAMLLVLTAIVWAAWYFAGLARLDPATVTRLRLSRLAEASYAYADRHGELPSYLADLGPDPVDGKPYSTADGWGRPVLYRRFTPAAAELRSFGPDGAPSLRAESPSADNAATPTTAPADPDGDDLVVPLRHSQPAR